MAATDTIDCVGTDSQGLTSTSTRTVTASTLAAVRKGRANGLQFR